MSDTPSAMDRLRAGEVPVTKFTFYTALDFPGMPELEWRIDDILPTTGLASVFGASRAGKTFLTLDMVTAIAQGIKWFGYETMPCPILYIGLEGQAGIRRRVAAWEKHNQTSFPLNVDFMFDDFSINNESDPFLLAMQTIHRSGAKVIVIDTLNRAAPDADENRSADMGKIITGATLLQRETNAVVILVHHTGKDASRSLRGHSSLFAALDTIIEVSKDGEARQWKVAKSKDGSDEICHGFRLVPVEIKQTPKGKMIRSCVVQEIEDYTPSQQGNEPTGANQRIILEAAKQSFLQQKLQIVVEGEDWKEGLPFDELLDQVAGSLAHIDPKRKKSRAKDALNALIRQGHLVLRDGRVGSPLSL